MQLLRDLVLIRPFRSSREGSLFTLEERKFSTSGRVVSVGPLVREVSPGDVVLWPPVGIDLPPQYLPYAYVLLHDEDGTEDFVLIDEEAEPIIREAVETYRANPSTEDRRITTKDLNAETDVRFLASNVRDLGPAELSQTGRLKTDYVEAIMVDIWDGSQAITHYIFHELQLEAIVHAAD